MFYILSLLLFISHLMKGNWTFELIDVSHLITACNDNFLREDLNADELILPSCSCDSSCVNFGDCCLDKLTRNGLSGLDYVPCRGNTHWGFSTYVKNKCKNDWNNTLIRGLCDGSIFSTLSYVSLTSFFSGLSYTNLFCAICNKEMEQDIEFWTSESNCLTELNETDVIKILRSIYKSVSQNLVTNNSELKECDLNFKYPSVQLQKHLRKCQPAISTCPQNWNVPQIAEKCLSYTSYVIGEREGIKGSVELYRNPHCALCNGIKVESMHLLMEINTVLDNITNKAQEIGNDLIQSHDLKHGRQMNATDQSEQDQTISSDILVRKDSNASGDNVNVTDFLNCSYFQVSVGMECVNLNASLEDISNSSRPNPQELDSEEIDSDDVYIQNPEEVITENVLTNLEMTSVSTNQNATLQQ